MNTALEKTGVLTKLFLPSFVTSLATVAENSFAAKRERVEPVSSTGNQNY
jgi:hypothetical protein